MTTRCLPLTGKNAFKSTVAGLAFAVGLAVFVPTELSLAADAKIFASPEAAYSALVDAANNDGMEGVLVILGPETEEWITSGDPAQDGADLDRFVAAYHTSHKIEIDSDGDAVLSVGEDGFPFPFPAVESGNGWVFDAERGKEEVLDRRIGRNELAAIKVLLAVADAQYEYAGSDHNDDGKLEYATKFASEEGLRDGLYWPTEEGEQPSPLGPLVAEARKRPSYVEGDPIPTYHGYHYALLSGQGDAAPGGARRYVEKGLAIGGFGAIAYPATYDNSGIMTFIIGYGGTVFQSDLGPNTEAIAPSIDLFDPAEGWTKVGLEDIE